MRRNLLFYLATQPSQFGEVIQRLHDAKLLCHGHNIRGWERIVVEKPFGHDLAIGARVERGVDPLRRRTPGLPH